MTGLTGRGTAARVVAVTAALAVLAVLALPGMALAQVPAPGAGAGVAARPNALRPLPPQRPVPVYAARFRRPRVARAVSWLPPAVRWPVPGAATAAVPALTAATRAGLARAARVRGGRANAVLAAATPGSARAGSEPVWVGPALRGAGTGAQRVRVAIETRGLAAKLGVAGVVLAVSRAGAGPGGLHLSLAYGSFAYADMGGYAARLHLVELPACALTTPSRGRCERQVALASGNNLATDRLGADFAMDPAPGGSGAMVVLAATTATSGSAGNFGATPLSDEGTWTAGGSSGAFTYSYPIPVPPVPGGLEPQVDLGYDSQAVDGLTSSTNDQASWIGDGWSYDPGYIERDYGSCEQTSAKTGDLCWSSHNVTTLDLGGHVTTLVQDSSTGTWRAQDDQGDTVTYKSGTGSNGTSGDSYWVVTTPDGTSYYFGLNELPGYAAGDAATNSAWTVPVYCPASAGAPSGCYNSTFSKAHQPMAWRWNLDYVTDAGGNAIAYFYHTETNYYAADNGTTATAGYTQAGALATIEYGLRSGAVYGATPAGEVQFTAPQTRTDIPTGSSDDLACSSGKACDVQSPTFWGKYQLTKIETLGLHGSALQPANSWALGQDYPATHDTTTAPSLWLDSITRTGLDGGSKALNPVTFNPDPMANRAETPTDLSDGYSLITRMRIGSVISEMGGTTQVTYDSVPAGCTSGNFPPPNANSTLCYPDYWTPPGASKPVEDWFNKYVVMAVTSTSTQVSDQAVQTSYCYGTSPQCMNGAAWHYNDDPLQKTSQRTWDQWRGFARVTTSAGIAPDPVTDTVDTYFQGMNGDYQPSGTTSASLSATIAGDTVTVPDDNQWAGIDFDQQVYNGPAATANLVSQTVTTPWSSAATATQTGMPSPLPDLQAFMTGTAKTQAFTALAAGGYREADTTYSHDSLGRVTSVASVPDAYDNGVAGDASEDTCAQTSYAGTTDLPAEVIETAGPPGSCPVPGTPAQSVLISDSRYYYDGSSTLGAQPTQGQLTEVTQAASYSGSSPSFTTQARYGYDTYGRLTSSTDANGNITKTAYQPSGDAEATTVTVTSPPTPNAAAGLVTTTTYDPLLGLPLTVTDPSGGVTTETYDPLGRLTAVWTPGHATSGPADETFSYTVSDTGPSAVETSAITPSGGYVTSYALYDSLGRQVETQAPTLDGGRDVTDYAYNSDGWQATVSGPYYAPGVPSATLVQAAPGSVPDMTGYFYDAAGRLTRQVLYKDGNELWETDTAYGGNYTTTTPPAGGTPSTTYINGIGRPSYIYQYDSAAPPTTPPAPGSGGVAGPGGWTQTAYAYTPAGQLAGITDNAGNAWTYTYNLLGEKVTQTTPDTGATSYSYDSNGNLTSVTDARHDTTSWTYDSLNRQTAEYDTTGGAAQTSADQIAAWTYDTLAPGKLTSSTAYPGGDTGTTATSYTQAVLGYNSYELPTGTSTIISGAPLAGTYKQALTYTPYANQLSSYYDYAAGGLPGETVDIGYNALGQPDGLTSTLADYVSGLSYDEFGQPSEYALGTTSEPAWIYNTYSQSTFRLKSSWVQAGTTPVTAADTTYSYDNAGLLASESDAAAGVPTQVQCFTYNPLGQLSAAWAQGTTGCASAGSQAAEQGAAAPYWNQYTYDDQGNLTSVTSTPPAGAAATTANCYPAAGSAQPHAVTTQTTATCSTATTANSSRWTYYPSGQLATATAPGGTVSNFNWTHSGQLQSITPAGTTTPTASYGYDAAGTLLLQTDGTTTTLYLPDEQITDTGGALSAVRYYTLGGLTIAARPAGGDVQYLAGDPQGTATIAIDAGTLAITRRYYDPYGNPIGPAPATWPGSKGFVNGTTDPATGLDNLGAREYNPATGSFITTDPILSPYQPADLNPYTYAADNPATNSDPTGLCGSDNGISWCRGPGPGPARSPRGNPGNPSLNPGPTAGGPICGYTVACPAPWAMPPRMYHNSNTDWPLLGEFISGIGARYQYFDQWDSMTRDLMNDPNTAQTIALIKQQLRNPMWLDAFTSGQPLTGSHNYVDKPNPLNFILDGLGALTAGRVGHNWADSFTGSYSQQYVVMARGPHKAIAYFTVTNATNLNSLLHPQQTWQFVPFIGSYFNVTSVSLPWDAGPFSETDQTFQWQEPIDY